MHVSKSISLMHVSKSIDLGSNFLVASSAEVTATDDGPHVTIWSRVGDGPRTAVKLNEAQFKRVVSMFRAIKKEYEGGVMRDFDPRKALTILSEISVLLGILATIYGWFLILGT